MKAKDLKVDDVVSYGGKIITVTAIRRTSLFVIVDYTSSASVGALLLKPSDDLREV